MNFAPAATARRQRHLDDRQYAADQVARREAAAKAAYESWTATTTIAQAIDYVDDQMAVMGPMLAEYLGAKFTAGLAYRYLADSYVRSVERKAGKAPWWDAKCTASTRLLWQAANGRAKALGC